VQGVNLLPGTLPPAVTSGGLVYDFTNLQTITGGNPAGAYTIYGASVNIGQQGTNTGQLKLLGTTSGQVTLSTQDAAGTWTLKLPATTGTVSQVLQTDGAGNTSWVTPAGGVGSTPGGATTNVQYNNAGSFGGAAGFTYNGVATVGLGAVGAGTGVVQLKGTTSGVVSLTTATAAGTWTMQLPTTAGSANQFLQTNGSGVCTWATGGGGPGTPAGSVQFNSVSAFAGSADFLWTTGTGLTVGGATLAGSVITAGAGEHQAIGTHAVIDTDVFAPGDPVHMSVQPGKPLVLNLVQYYAGDLSVGHSRNNIATGVGLKHTGAAKAFTYNYSGGAVVTSDSTGPWSAFGEMHLAPVNYGSGLVDYMVGALIEVENEGTATTMYAIDLAAQQGSGTVGTVAAIHISPSFGTVTNCYGMLIDDFATSHGTNKFPIYVKGGAQTCAIEGALSLGLAATNTGKLKLAGTTSGVVTLQSQDVAGTWTMQLPTTAGSANQVLQTNGSGVCTWATAGAGGVNAGTINQLAYYAAAGSVVSGETVLQAVNMPALVGDVTTPGGSLSATIAAGVVTNAKLATMAASSFKGNTTGATAAPTDMTVANAWTLLGVEPAANSPAFTGDVTKPSGSLAQTIAASVVTNAKMANMVTATIKGNNSGSTGAPLDLTTTQVTAMLNNFTTALAGLAPASGGGTTNFLRADGTWTAPAGGGVNAGTINQLAYYAAAGSTVSGETLLQAANHPALTGDVTCTAGTVATVIAANAVNNPKLAQAIANSFKGNPTGALANVTDMTGTAATALLNIFTTALQGLVPASGGGTTNFLRADGTWNTPGIPINNQSVAYTAVLADANTAITHPTTDNTARTFTIPANSSVAYPIGTTLTFVNMINTLTIAITTDTMTLAGPGTTGSRTLAANGIATALKLTSTTWLISGTGLT
jgi:hypothetical protein